jgi:hypothetical protein
MVKGKFWKISKKLATIPGRKLPNYQDFLEDLGRFLLFFF